MFYRKAKWLAAMAIQKVVKKIRLQLAYGKSELLETA